MSRQPVSAVHVLKPGSWASGTSLWQLLPTPPKSWYALAVMIRGGFRRHPRWGWGTVTWVAVSLFVGSYTIGALLLGLAFCLGLTAWIGWRRRCGAAPANLRDLQAEDKRRRQIKRQWPVACGSARIERTAACGGGPPPLGRMPADPSDGSFKASIDPTATGIVADDLAKHSGRLAKVIGCKDVLVREKDDGKTELTFFWTDALGRHVSLADLPFAPEGQVAYGVRSDGKTAATIDPRLPVLWTGLTGAGKSNATWVAIADMLRQGMHVRLYISDVKITELARFEEYVGQVNGTLDVRAYANTVAGADAMFKSCLGALTKRTQWMKERGLRKIECSAENPAVIVWVDEVLKLQEILKAGAGSSLAEVAYLGRAAHMTVWVSAQVGHIDSLGRLRSLLVQRVCFRTDSREATTAALGSDTAAQVADCHRGLKPGRGWSRNDQGELLPFKAAMVRDDEADLIAQGIIPEGMARPLQGQRTALYRHFDEAMVLLYLGISNDYFRRSGQHAEDKEWWKDVRSSTVEWWSNRDLALEAERVRTPIEKPLYNIQNNPDRVRRPRTSRRPKADTPLELAEAATLDFAKARQSAKAKAAA